MSYPSTHCYETLYILRGGISEGDASTIHQKVDSVIAKFHGKPAQRDDWGIKELAYTIAKQKSGRMSVIQYTGNPGVVEEIERHFRISTDVIRFLTVSVSEDYDYAKVKRQIHLAEEEASKIREQKRKY